MRILDTDVCVEIIRGNRQVVDRRLATEDSVVTTWVTACELMHGAAKSRSPETNRGVVAVFLGVVRIVDFTPAVADRFGRLKASLNRAGARLDDFDLLIGATALVHDSVLVTGNLRHYERIDGLRSEDWIRG